MRLSKIAILALKGTGADVKDQLALALGVSNKSIYRYISDNHDNLTKASALPIIRKVTGLSDVEILEGLDGEIGCNIQPEKPGSYTP